MRCSWLLAGITAAGCVNIPPFKGVTSDAGGDGGGPAPDAAPGVCAAALAIPDLKMYLPMNEGAGSAVRDASTHGNDGSLANGTAWSPGGRVGGALVFDGVDDKVTLDPTAFDQLAPGITVCMWIRPDAPVVSSANLVDKSTDGLEGGWNTYLQGGGDVRLGFYTRYKAYKQGITNLALGAWHHVCSVWDGTAGDAGIQLYLDAGIETIGGNDAGEAPQADDSDASIAIGGGSNPLHYFKGAIDELMIFSRHLTANEIATLHACAP